jgi:hypothetical protein
MSPNFQSLCYLAAWEKNLTVEGGLAWAAQLRQCKLDYSWASLSRIDRFLDAFRVQRAPRYEAFFDEQANTNLLVFLAFYVIEVRSRADGKARKIIRFDDLQQQNPQAADMIGQGFESLLIEQAESGSQFLPLVSICNRLFEIAPDKSVAFSAGTGLTPPADPRLPLPLRVVPSLIPDFYDRFMTTDLPPDDRRWAHVPWWERQPTDDPLHRVVTDAPKLLKTCRVVWGAVVQSNNQLADPKYQNVIAPVEVVYDPAGRVDRMDLYAIAQRLNELKNEPQTDPALNEYAQHLRAETTRIFGWRTPASLYPYELEASTTNAGAEHNFPSALLVNPLIPLMVSDECPGSVLFAPWQLWPSDVFHEWNRALRAKLGDEVRLRQQPKRKAIASSPSALPRSEPLAFNTPAPAPNTEQPKSSSLLGKLFGRP